MSFINNSDTLDQHFLCDKNIINKFVDFCNISREDVILEVGPGKGILTEIFCQKASKVICIELDQRLKPYLDELMMNNPNLSVIYGNVLEEDLPNHTKLITALPYSIIEPFIYKLANEDYVDVTMIMGKRYVDAVINNEVSMLALLTNCFFDAKFGFDIAPDAFNPQPRVMSSVINLKSKEEKNISDPILRVFWWMFYYKDKKIKNALIESLIKAYQGLYNITLTQNNCRELISGLDENILENKFETCSNDELQVLYDKVRKIIKEK